MLLFGAREIEESIPHVSLNLTLVTSVANEFPSFPLLPRSPLFPLQQSVLSVLSVQDCFLFFFLFCMHRIIA